MMMADDIVVSDSKGKGKSTDPALNEEKKEDDDDDEDDDEPVILSGRRKRNVVNYADVRISLFPLSLSSPLLSPYFYQTTDTRSQEEGREKKRKTEKKELINSLKHGRRLN
jgi:hypothetical protein